MLSQIQQHLSHHPWRDRIYYFDTIDSTNSFAKKLAAEGAVSGTIILAGHQSAGRGRLGRSFSSPKNMGIYLSVILRPNCKPSEIMHLTCAAGVAAVRAIDNDKVGIKWTNDLVMDKKKIGGILTELSIDPVTQIVNWAVVGIGINCFQRNHDFPHEIRHMASSLGLKCQDDMLNLTVDLIASVYQMDQDLLLQKAEILSEFEKKCVTIGNDICVIRGESIRHGTAVGLDKNGGLLIKYPDASFETVTSGEVSIRGMYGYV